MSQSIPYQGANLIEQQHGDLRYTQFPQFLQFSEMLHGVFTRIGGYSPPPYHGLNTMKKSGDSIENIVRNRQLLLRALDLEQRPTVTLWQIHGADVTPFHPHPAWRTDWAMMSHFERRWTPDEIRKGDALITCERGTTLTLCFADCVPIIFYDPVQHAIGIAHGGWRGTARGIVIATVEAMREQFGSRPQDIHAGIGPAIGSCCYEVSETIQQTFMGQLAFDDHPTLPRYQQLVRESAVFSIQQLPDRESLRLDLQETNRRQLLMAGLPSHQIELMPACTSCNTDRYFSHRAENGQTGRFSVVISLAA